MGVKNPFISTQIRASSLMKKGLGVWGVFLFLILILTACTPQPVPPVKRIALLAPFEGRYREIGYDAIYPIRLALKEANSELVLVTADDGGTLDSAVIQARRLADDPTLLVALVIGSTATQPEVLAAFGDVPVVVIGAWDTTPSKSVFVLASEALASVKTTHTQAIGIAVDTSTPVTGGEIFALKQYPKLRPHLDGVTVALSALPADADFAARLIASDLFVPAPGALSTLAYDAGGLIHTVITTQSATTRDAVNIALKAVAFTGLNGRIAFTADGWWEDAPVITYHYADGVLTSLAP